MAVIRLEKYGVVMVYDGSPIWLCGVCITSRRFAWWWPWNWIVLACALPLAVFRARKKHNTHNAKISRPREAG